MQSRPERCREVTNHLPHPGMETRFLCRPARSRFAVPTELLRHTTGNLMSLKPAAAVFSQAVVEPQTCPIIGRRFKVGRDLMANILCRQRPPASTQSLSSFTGRIVPYVRLTSFRVE